MPRGAHIVSQGAGRRESDGHATHEAANLGGDLEHVCQR